MSTVRFRYGFHPEGFDPLLALRATQPATAVQVPATVIPRQELTVPSTLVACPPAFGEPQVLPRRIVGQERSRQGRGWGRFLWASLVLLSAGVAGTVWATGVDSTTGAETTPLAFAAPTIIEPEVMPSDQSAFVVTTDVEPSSSPAMKPPAVSHPTPRKSSPVPSTTVPSTTVPPTSEPSQPSASRVPPALPSVSLPPAVVWTPAPGPEKPSTPVTTPETPQHRPDVVARPEPKPTLRVPPVAHKRTPVSKPKTRPASPVTAGNMTRVTK